MYLDHTDGHERYAAYEIDWTNLDSLFNSPMGQYIIKNWEQKGQFDRDQLGQQRDIAMAEIDQRARASNATARSAANSVKAQLSIAKMQHEAQMARLRELDLPALEMERADRAGRLRIAEMAQRLNEQTLAADVVKTAASMGGPGDWVQAANYARGISQTQIPEFLKRLVTGGDTYNLSGDTTGPNTPQSYGGLIDSLSGGAAQTRQDGTGATTVGGRNWADINAMADSVMRNPGKLALGSIEGLTGDEQQMLGSLIRARGGSANTFTDAYRRSRFSTDAGAAMAA